MCQIGIFCRINLLFYLQQSCLLRLYFNVLQRFLITILISSSDIISDWHRWLSQGSFCVEGESCDLWKAPLINRARSRKLGLTENVNNFRCDTGYLLLGFLFLSSRLTQRKPGQQTPLILQLDYICFLQLSVKTVCPLSFLMHACEII